MPLPLILKKHEGFYALPLFEPFGVRALFTTRVWDMRFGDPLRTKAYKALRINGRDIVCPSQVHGDTVAVVAQGHRGRGAYRRATALRETDGLITSEKKLSLAVLTADCMPVFLYDPKRKVMALVHAGWKGTRKRIIAQAIKKMAKDFSTEPADLLVALGPSLRRCCYEVGGEFQEYFPGDVQLQGGKFYFDLGGAVLRQLSESGIAAEHIYDSRICTSCMNHEFFSYRKEGAQAGRSMSLMELEEDVFR